MTTALFLRRTGQGHPVVFLGGCPTWWDVLSPLAQATSPTHEAVEVALPGYGPSASVPLPADLLAAHQLVEDTLLDAGIREAAFAGFSAGAYRALAIATRGRVRATHVLSLGGLARLSPVETEGFRGFAAGARAGQDFSGLATQRFLSPAFAAAHPAAARDVEAWLHAVPMSVLAQEFEAFAVAEDLTPRLHEITAPVVARVGALDVAGPMVKSEEIVRGCARATLEVVEGAGHSLVHEDLAGTIASLHRLLAT